MIPVKTYRTTDFLYFQCDGKNHFRVERDNGFSELLSPCDKVKCEPKKGEQK